MMAAILDRHQSAEVAAKDWLKSHPDIVKAWLTDVLTLVGHGKSPGTHKIQYRTVTATGN